jgi:hypothetical protein
LRNDWPKAEKQEVRANGKKPEQFGMADPAPLFLTSAFLAHWVGGIFGLQKHYGTQRGVSMPDITNPHDRFFKEVFSRPDVAEDFLFHFLPRDVSSLLRPGTFRLSKDSFVDANLKEYYSDLLYQVDFKGGEPGFVCLL